MASSPDCTVFVGNLDERVSDRVLYDILIQAGRLVDLYVPRDKETDRPKGYAFAQYETEEIANYAVKLFSGLVTLYNRTLRFAISGQDKPTQNSSTAPPPSLNATVKPKSHPAPHSDIEVSPHSARLSTYSRFSEHRADYSQVPVSPGVPLHHPNGYRSYYDRENYDYGRREYGAALDSFSRPSLGRYDSYDPPSRYPYH